MWMYLPVVCSCCCWVGGFSLEHTKQIARVLGFASKLQRLMLKPNEQNWTSGSQSEAGAARRNAGKADRKQACHGPEPWPLMSLFLWLCVHACLMQWCRGCIRTSCCPKFILVSCLCLNMYSILIRSDASLNSELTNQLYTMHIHSFPSSSVICPSLYLCFHLISVFPPPIPLQLNDEKLCFYRCLRMRMLSLLDWTLLDIFWYSYLLSPPLVCSRHLSHAFREISHWSQAEGGDVHKLSFFFFSAGSLTTFTY